MDKQKRPQTAATPQVANPFTQSQKSSSAKKLPQQLSYKDYTIKEETHKFKQQKHNGNGKNISDLKTTTTSLKPSVHQDTHTFKQNVQRQFNNFLAKGDMIDDDDSLLQDSQASMTRDEKKENLAQQRLRRKREAEQKKAQEEELARKKKQQLLALEKRQQQNLTKVSKHKASVKSLEKSKERSLQKKTAELVERHRPLQDEGAAAQLKDLKSWIEQQMREERLEDPDCSASEEQESLAVTQKSKSNKDGATLISMKEAGVTTEKQRTQMLKHQLPGNSLLSEKEDSKLGARQNRYGVFDTGKDEFQKVVEIQREKLEPKKAPKPPKLTPEQQAIGKEHVVQLIMKLAQQTGSIPKTEVEKSQGKDDLSEDSCDKVPVRDTSVNRLHRAMINQKVKDGEIISKKALPGITDTKKHQADIDKAQKIKEAEAALVIQRFLRGHWGRVSFARMIYVRRHEIDVEYAQFQRDYKDTNYNIKAYLRDKQRVRKETGLDSIAEDVIAEVIGESSGSAHQISTTSTRIQNFFSAQTKSDYDPLSLIAIYAKRNGKIPEVVKVAPKKRNNEKKDGKKTRPIQSSSEILEEIYSEKFSESESGIIEEDIPKASDSLSSKKVKKVQESDSIIDEVQSAQLSKSDPNTQDDSIVDEAQPAVADSDLESEIIEEDSIIKDEFESDNFQSSKAEKLLEARNRIRFGVQNSQNLNPNQQQAFLKTQEQNTTAEIKHKNILSEMVTEMKLYEASNINQAVIDRMEKIVVSSLAQKDQIIMAQSLADLQKELRHKDEINRIREEQIRLMTQLMMLGGTSVAIQDEAKRKELMQSLDRLMTQSQSVNFHPEPVERLTHQQLYQQRKSMSYLEEYDQSKNNRQPAKQLPQPAAPQPDPIKVYKQEQSASEIEDEIGSVHSQESLIAEEIAESYISISQSSGQFEDFKRRQYKLVQENKQTLEQLFTQIEQSINRERDQKETKLNAQLKKRQLSPRSFARQRSDLENWTKTQRQELRESHRKLQVEQQITQTKQQQQPYNQASIISKPQQKSHSALAEDSADSEAVKMAINQAHLLEQGLIGQTPDQKYIQRKKEAADKLLREKERAIQEQLNVKLKVFEKEQADETLQKALELNVEREAERRFEQYKRALAEEQSLGQESARSLSQSKESSRFKKNVKFADQQKNKPDYLTVPTASNQQIESSGNIEESINESIQDSYSQSFRSSAPDNSKPDNKPVGKAQEAIQAQTMPAHRSDMSQSIADMISEQQYSEEFLSEHQESGKFSTSKNKLHSKAQSLAQSDNYSEDDFEESLGQQQNNPLSNQDKTPKMESVKEESGDVSSQEQRDSPEQQSLPSQDETVQESVQEIDWQIQIPDTARDQHSENLSELKESIQESINDRIDQDELESNPDEIQGMSQSKSASKSDTGDLFGKADRIAQELLDLILAEYKGDNQYLVSCESKKIDEELFRDKFPYTLDVREPEIVIRPPVLQSEQTLVKPSTPKQKVKTQKEIDDENFLKKHQDEQDQLAQQQKENKAYLDFLVSCVNFNELISAIDQPIRRNPIQVLAEIQTFDDEEPPEIDEPEPQQVLQQTFFNKVDKQFFSQKDATYTPEQEKIRNVHNYALFEALNEALDLQRPYKTKGEPMPWSINTRAVKQETSYEQAKKILQDAVKTVMEWSVTRAGSKFAPLPPPPTQTQDEYGDDIEQPPLAQGEEERRNQHRQEKLGQLMTQDIQETDQLWIDYEIEETQAKFDLADMILTDLAMEIAQLLL